MTLAATLEMPGSQKDEKVAGEQLETFNMWRFEELGCSRGVRDPVTIRVAIRRNIIEAKTELGSFL